MRINNSKSKIRWLHLSDLHIGKDDYAQRKLFHEIIKHIKERINEGLIPDFIFITGDIADKGRHAQYGIFISEFLKPLINLFPDYLRQRIFIVPGNHDVFIETHEYFSREEICGSESRFFDPTNEGLKKRSQILPRFKAYSESLDSFPNEWIDSTNGSYSHKINISHFKIGIVGINTAWLAKGKGEEYDRHKLSPGINLLDDALESVEDTHIKIVLGHHPVDWFDESNNHKDPIKAILGKHHAIYLHGHLHKSRVSPEDGAGHGFLCVQSGAAFQTRDDDIWVNGFLWAEIDLKSRELLIQPREWSPVDRDWRIGKDLPEKRRLKGSDWWIFPIPGEQNHTAIDVSKSSISNLRYPEGWQIVDHSFLDREKRELDESQLLRFFDGANPDWRIATSCNIPRFSIVEKLKYHLENYHRKDRPQVVLLIGPVGEGKSTALMQIVLSLLEVDKSWNILWHADEFTGLKLDDFMKLPVMDSPWLLVSDSADIIAKDIHEACKHLKREHRGDIRFLLACRDTDWINAMANKWDWISFADFHREEVVGIEDADARLLVESWINFGEKAIGRLAGLDLDEATKEFIEAARKEATRKEGALIGAMLTVRYGENLKEHIKTLLYRLSSRKIPGGSDLMLALAYIAAMHNDGLYYLSRPVLSEAVCCPLEKLNPLVLAPLGMEAAVSNDGQFVLTRHKKIAEITVELLQSIFELDIDELFKELINSAMTTKWWINYVPKLSNWEYNFPMHFALKGRDDLAIRFGNIVLEREPNKSGIVTNLAAMHRMAGSPSIGVKLLSEFEGKIFKPRRFQHEWGISEKLLGNENIGIFHLFFSISDQVSKRLPENKHAKAALLDICDCCKTLYKEYLNSSFNKLINVAAKLGLLLRLDQESKNNFYKYFKYSSNENKSLNSDIKKLQESKSIFQLLDKLFSKFVILMRPLKDIMNKFGKNIEHSQNEPIVNYDIETIDLEEEFSAFLDLFSSIWNYFESEIKDIFKEFQSPLDLTFNGFKKLLYSSNLGVDKKK